MGMMTIHYPAWVAALFLAGLVTGCFEPPSFVDPGEGDFATQANVQKVKTKKLGQYGVQGKVKANSKVPQKISASGGTNVDGTEATFPPGSLSVDTDVSVEEGGDFVDKTTKDAVGLSDDDAEQAGKPVVINSSEKVDPGKSFDIAISTDTGKTRKSSGLVQADFYYIVVYNVTVHETGKNKVGIIPTNKLKVADGKVKFKAKYFGSYSVVKVKRKITEEKETESSRQIVTQRDKDKDTTPPGAFAVENVPKLASQPFKVTWQKAEDATNYRITVNKDEKCEEPVRSVIVGKGTSGKMEGAPEGDFHLCVYALDQVENEKAADNNSLPVEIDDTPPQATAKIDGAPSGPSNANQANITVTADGGVWYKAKAVSGGSGACDDGGSFSERQELGADLTVDVSAVADGKTTLCVILRDKAGNWQAPENAATVSWTRDTKPPAVPEVTGTNPESPNDETSVSVTGTAESGTTVNLHKTKDCSDTVVASGSASDFESPGLSATVAAQGKTVFGAAAVDTAGNVSACSTVNDFYMTPYMVPQVDTSSGSSISPFDFHVGALGDGTLVYTAQDGSSGRELWKWNPQDPSSSPVQIQDINTGTSSSTPVRFFPYDGKLLFSASDGTNGRELWITDGTSSGTQMVKDLAGTASGLSYNPGFMPVGDKVLFFAQNGDGVEPWVTDGTSAGTQQVKNIDGTTSNSTEPYGSRALYEGDVYFSATDGTNGKELWRTDGTATGTQMVKDIHPGGASDPIIQTVYDGDLYFVAYNPTYGDELWRTDGTAGGTELVKDIASGSAGAGVGGLVEFKGELYFLAFDGTEDALWKTDGTTSGTVKVEAVTYVEHMFPTKDWLILVRAGTSVGATELWRSDGTSGGLESLTTINSTREYGAVLFPFTYEEDAYFLGVGDSETMEVWRTDGTPGGTEAVSNLGSSPTGGCGAPPVLLEDMLYFYGDDGNGQELWVVDLQ